MGERENGRTGEWAAFPWASFRTLMIFILLASPFLPFPRSPVLPALAQQPTRQGWRMAPEYRAVQVRAQETQRTLLLAMADSMPEIHYRERVTPEQQIGRAHV